MKKLSNSLLIGPLILTIACGSSENLAECKAAKRFIPCSERTSEEDARLALERGDFDQAIEILIRLVEESPDVYSLYTLLAAAYAARAKVAVVDLVLSSLTSSGGSLVDQVGAFLPQPAEVGMEVYTHYLEDIARAIDYLKSIPESLRATTSSEKYAKSAQLQLSIYGIAYSVMYLNQFVATTGSGGLDTTKLASISEADALLVISSLTDAAQIQAAGGSSVGAEKINATLTQINNQPGATQNERLQNYVRVTRGS